MPSVWYKRIGKEHVPYYSEQTFRTNSAEKQSSMPTGYEIVFRIPASMEVFPSCAGTPITQLNFKTNMSLDNPAMNSFTSIEPQQEEICNPAPTIVASWVWRATEALSERLFLTSIQFDGTEMKIYISYQIPILRQ